MYFKKSIILFAVLALVTISESAVRRKVKKIKKCSYASVPAPCVCQKPALDVGNCGCRKPMIESALAALAPFEITIPGLQSPVIEVPNYRPAEPVALNPLGCLFPSYELPNYEILPAPLPQPSVEYYAAVDLPCGCPNSNCGCRPPVKLPAYEEYVATIEVPNCGYQNIQISGVPTYSYSASVIEIPSYGPAPVIQIPSGYRKPVPPPCGCQGSCSCSGYPVSSSCGCQEPCSCAEYQILSCGCQGSCSCPAPKSCGCQSPCGCANIPKSCGCQAPCSCIGYPSPCSCQEPCSCAEYQNLWSYPSTSVSSCGCQNPCGCAGIPKPCTCQGSCGCSGIQATVALLPTMEASPCGCQGPCQCPGTIELPICGCGCNIPGCNCGQNIRQLTLQPPFI